MSTDQLLREIAALSADVKKSVERSQLSEPALRDQLNALDWRIKQLKPAHGEPDTPPERDQTYDSSHYVITVAPEVIDAVVHVTVFVAETIAAQWVARADNHITQSILRRRKAKRPPTPTQIRDFARLRINTEWPGSVRPADDPESESRGPNSWSVIWVKDGVAFEASGDNDLHEVTLRRSVVRSALNS